MMILVAQQAKLFEVCCINTQEAGKSVIQIEGQVKRIAQQLGIVSWHISISHTPNSSTAFVIAESE